MSPKPNDSTKHLSAFQLLMLVLSIYVLLALLVEAVCKLSPETQSILGTADTAICFIFLGDFSYRWYQAENRRAFLKWGWIDFVSSIPVYGVFRLARIVRVVRILRSIRSAKYILTIIFQNKAKGTFSVVATVSLVLLIFSAVVILNVETTPDANIKTGSDALWWAITTITTVGYGDRYPVTDEGRVVGAILMVVGVGFFGTFTAYVATFFLSGNKSNDEVESELAKELRLLRERLEGIEKSISRTSVKPPAQFGTPPIEKTEK
jgi:voltage-gated potassium channel